MLLVWIFLLSAFQCSLSLSTKVLSLVALDAASLQACERFLQALDVSAFASIFVIYTDIDPQSFSPVSSNDKATITYKHIPVIALKPTAISRHVFPQEKITAILKAMRFVIGGGNINKKESDTRSRVKEGSHVIQVVFDRHTSSAISGSNAINLDTLYSLSADKDVTLLSKTRQFSSLSDWRDLLLFSYHHNEPSHVWVDAFEYAYLTYAGGILDDRGRPVRTHFTMHDPRFAIQEANVQSQAKVQAKGGCKVGYWSRQAIDIENKAATRIPPSTPAVVAVSCTASDSFAASDVALVCHLHDGESSIPGTSSSSTTTSGGGASIDGWRREVSRGSGKIEERFTSRCNIPPEGYGEHPITAQWCGIERFRYYDDKEEGKDDIEGSNEGKGKGKVVHTKPRDFCWHTGSPAAETRSTSRIYANSTASQPLPSDLYDNYQSMTSSMTWKDDKHKILFVSASNGKASVLDKRLYIALSKQYYVSRHEGYGSYFVLSTAYDAYIHPTTFETSNNPLARPLRDGTLTYLRTIMSKTLMVAAAMLANPHYEWILWTDDDAYINTGWLEMPVEVYLKDVPAHKLFVSANYRYAPPSLRNPNLSS